MSQDEELDTLAGRYEFNGVTSERIINQTFRNTLEKYIKSREATLIREARIDELAKFMKADIKITLYGGRISDYTEKRISELTNQQKGL